MSATPGRRAASPVARCLDPRGGKASVQRRQRAEQQHEADQGQVVGEPPQAGDDRGGPPRPWSPWGASIEEEERPELREQREGKTRQAEGQSRSTHGRLLTALRARCSRAGDRAPAGRFPRSLPAGPYPPPPGVLTSTRSPRSSTCWAAMVDLLAVDAHVAEAARAAAGEPRRRKRVRSAMKLITIGRADSPLDQDVLAEPPRKRPRPPDPGRMRL